MITLEFFAGLKDYFPSMVEVQETPENINSLRKDLIKQQSFASTLLQQCRFAVDDTFVDEDYKLGQGDHVLVIPPSSGG